MQFAYCRSTGHGDSGWCSGEPVLDSDHQWVTIQAPFRAYHNFAESIEDHGELLATSGYYTQAMANRTDPDAFAKALTFYVDGKDADGRQLLLRTHTSPMQVR